MQNISFNEALDIVTRQDSRYHRDAYAFLREALDFTLKKQRKASREEARDVPASDLLEGCRLYALKEFGPMAPTVLGYWGVESCEDIGNLVFNLVDAKVFSKTEKDTLDAFRKGFDFDAAFLAPFRPEKKRLSNFRSPCVSPGS